MAYHLQASFLSMLIHYNSDKYKKTADKSTKREKSILQPTLYLVTYTLGLHLSKVGKEMLQRLLLV